MKSLLILLLFANPRCDLPLLNDLYRAQTQEFGTSNNLKYFRNKNCQAYKNGLLKPIDLMADTIYLLNSFSEHSDRYELLVYTKKDTVCLYDTGEGLDSFKVFETGYSDFLYQKISKWDTTYFRQALDTLTIIHEYPLFISRIINNGNRRTVDCIKTRIQNIWFQEHF
jgi:hypothetical protein